MIIALLRRVARDAAAAAADFQLVARAVDHHLAGLADGATPTAETAATPGSGTPDTPDTLIAASRVGADVPPVAACPRVEGSARQLGMTAPAIRKAAKECLEHRARWTASADLAVAILHYMKLPDDPASRKDFADACSSIFSRAARKRRAELLQRKPDGKDAQYGLPGWDVTAGLEEVPPTVAASAGSRPAARQPRDGAATGRARGGSAGRKAPPKRQ